MNQVFIVPYHSIRDEELFNHFCAQDFKKDWPFDFGDDPGFFYRLLPPNRNNGLSWGICRPDIRRTLHSGDVVVFIAYYNLNFSLTAICTVAQTLSHCDIASISEHSYYRDSTSRLLKFDGECYIHNEWCEEKRWHSDWLWRMVNLSHHDFEKLGLKAVQKLGKFSRYNTTVLNSIAKSFIIFENDDRTRILENPILLAKQEIERSKETWLNESPNKNRLKEILMEDTRGYLYCSGKPYPLCPPPKKCVNNVEIWRTSAMELLDLCVNEQC